MRDEGIADSRRESHALPVFLFPALRSPLSCWRRFAARGAETCRIVDDMGSRYRISPDEIKLPAR